jgi:hypothetical protein
MKTTPFIRSCKFEYDINDENIYKVLVFDDGNDTVIEEYNYWKKVGYDKDHPEKIAISNIKIPHYINSISEWKICKINS